MWLFFAEGGEGVEMSDKEKIGSPTSSALGEETANPRPPKKHLLPPPDGEKEKEKGATHSTFPPRINAFPARDLIEMWGTERKKRLRQ